jgi:hypothetical protein
MIRSILGTVFITAECFCDRCTHALSGHPFRYATGDLDMACEKSCDARKLRSAARAMELQKLIDLSQRKLPTVRGSKSTLEYLATKRGAA